jgi:hypothetical protein
MQLESINIVSPTFLPSACNDAFDVASFTNLSGDLFNTFTDGFWWSLATSSDGTKLAGVTVDGIVFADRGNIYTSIDSGNQWAEVFRGNGGWRGISSSADGTKLVAVSNGVLGQTYTSTDSGATWLTGSDPFRQYQDVDSSADGNNVVTCVFGTGTFIYTSTDAGVTWTPREDGDASYGFWRGVASSSDGVNLAAVNIAGDVYTSSNSGVSWTNTGSTEANANSIASSSDGTRLIVASLAGNIHTSTNSGVTFTPRGSALSYQDVASSADGTVLGACTLSTTTGRIYISTDSGVTWIERGPASSWLNIVISDDGTKMAAAGIDGVYTSTDTGTTWVKSDGIIDGQAINISSTYGITGCNTTGPVSAVIDTDSQVVQPFSTAITSPNAVGYDLGTQNTGTVSLTVSGLDNISSYYFGFFGQDSTGEIFAEDGPIT